MKYVVLRVPTNAQGTTVPDIIGNYSELLVAQSHFHEEVADAASKVNADGRLADGAFLITSEGEYLDSKFFKAET